MTQERSHKASLVSFVFLSIGILAIPIALLTLAQVAEAGGQSAVPSAGAMSPSPTTPLFSPVVTYPSGGFNAMAVAIADVNGDGKPDLVTANRCAANNNNSCPSPSTVGVLLGNGDGTFQTAGVYDSGGDSAASIAVADVNGDGRPDVLVTNACNKSGCLNGAAIGVLLGNGDGSFQPVVSYDPGVLFPISAAVADVNGDGNLDLLVAGISVGVLLGNGDGTFRTVVPYGSGGNGARDVVVVDVNGDGKPDVLVLTNIPVCGSRSCTFPTALAVLLGNGDGTFQPAFTRQLGGWGAGGGLVVADVNGDGKPDVLVPDQRAHAVAVLLGKGNGRFRRVGAYATGGQLATALVLADVDGDHNLDVLAAETDPAGNGMVSVLLGNGDGTFQAAMTFASGGYVGAGYYYGNSVAAADLNSDGKPDLAVANDCNSNICNFGTVGVLLNNTGTADTTPPVITLSATPKILRPPDGRMVPVTITGTITDPGSGINLTSAEYAVQDEYHLVQPSGKITLDSAGNYSFTILLPASRQENDSDGRQFTIRASARDNAGNRAAQWARVKVPHGD